MSSQKVLSFLLCCLFGSLLFANWEDDGTLSLDINGGDNSLRAAVFQDDGKLVGVGRAPGIDNYDYGALVRFNADGSLDTTFGTGGFILHRYSARGYVNYHDVFLESDGKIVVTGRFWTASPSTFDLLVARFHTSGARDTTFGNDGRFTLSRTEAQFGRKIAQQSDNKIVVAGFSEETANNYDFLLLRLETDGTLDPTFEGDGISTYAIGTGHDVLYGMFLTDDKPVVAGYTYDGTRNNIAIARFLTDGLIDTTFSSDGNDTFVFTTGGSAAFGVALTSNGYAAAGRAITSGNSDFGIVEWDTTGARLVSNTYDMDGGDDYAHALHIQGTRRLMIGRRSVGTNFDFAALRTANEPGFDGSFGTAGTANADISNDDFGFRGVIDSALRTIVVGRSYSSGYNFGVASFETDGTLRFSTHTDFGGNRDDSAYGVTIDGSDRIIAGGYHNSGSENDFAIARYLTNGALDTTFSGDGLHTIDISADDSIAQVLLADPRIYAVGSSHDGTDSDLAIVGFVTDGSLDTTFGTNGMIRAAVGSGDDFGHNAILDDGKIVVSGASLNGSSWEAVIARFLTDGSYDTSFHADGRRTFTFSGSSDDASYTLAAQDDNKVIVGSQVHNAGFVGFGFARFLTNGALDTTFGIDGQSSVGMDTTAGAQLHGISIDTNGRIVGVGRTYDLEQQVAVVRLLSTGAIDTNFGTEGRIASDRTPGDDVFYDVMIASDDSIMMMGSSYTNTYDFSVSKFVLSESLDGSFGTGGKQTAAPGSNNDDGWNFATSNNQLIIVGRTYNGTNWDFGLARFDTNGGILSAGRLDTTFTYAVGAGNDKANALANDSNGNTLLAGSFYNGSNGDVFVARILDSGELDTTFGTSGMTSVQVGSGTDRGSAMVIDGTNKILVAGSSVSGSDVDFAVLRFLTDGTLDNTFSGDGIQTSSFAANGDAKAYAIVVQSDNKPIVGGQHHNATNNAFALARYETDGTLDNTFSGDGLQLTELDTTGGARIHALGLDSSERIIAVGQSTGMTNEIAVARYNTDGTLDNTFDSDGVLLYAINSSDAIGYAVGIDGSDRVVVAGTSKVSEYDFAIVRFLTNGAIDTTFATSGSLLLDVGTDDMAYSLAFLSNGKILITGRSGDDFGVARLTENGGIDTSFSGDGNLTQAVGLSHDVATGIALTQDGRILVGGYYIDGTDSDLFLSRFWP